MEAHRVLHLGGRIFVDDAVGPDLGFVWTPRMPHADHVPGEIRRYVGKHRRYQAWSLRQLGADALYQFIEMLAVVIAYNPLGHER